MSDATEPGVRTTNYPAIKNAPMPAEGNGQFSNVTLAALVLGVPFIVKRILPVVNWGGFYTYWFLVAILGVPVTIGYWTAMSVYGSRKNEKCRYPGKPMENYIDIKDAELKRRYTGNQKIPMQIFHDAFFDNKIDFKG
jgi:hypothetical protein